MNSVADYQILRAEVFTLPTNGDHDRVFNLVLPSTLSTTAAILSFTVTTIGANDLRAQVELTNVDVTDLTVFSYGPSDTNITRPFQHVIGKLKAGSNHLKFRVVSGAGTFTVSNVVVWYQINV